MTYYELEKMLHDWGGDICIFGTGNIGRTWGYDILVAAAEKKIKYYCDSYTQSGVVIRDNVETIDFDGLCREKDKLLIVVAANEYFHEEISSKFENNEITNYVLMGDCFLQEFCESVIHAKDEEVFEKYKYVVDDREFVCRRYSYFTGKKLELENPKTFNEKIQWLKIYDHNPQYCKLADKYEFKKYINETFGEEYTIPLLGVWYSADEIEWDKLPEKFVLKCTHDSGSVIICKDKSALDIQEVTKSINEKLKLNYYWISREWQYKSLKPRVIAEEYVEEGGELRDYKVYCFGGRVKFIHIDFDRFQGHTRNLYDTNWEFVPLEIKYKSAPHIKVEKPQKLQEMIAIAEKLAEGIPFVRVDFYIIDNSLKLGEMTFHPGSGHVEYSPKHYELQMGEWIPIWEPEKNN